MIIKILNDELVATNVITHIISLQWYDRWQDAGTFELHTNDDILKVGDILAFQFNGIIFGGFVSRLEKYDTEIVATGYDFKGLLKRRYMYEDVSFSDGDYISQVLIKDDNDGLLQKPMLRKTGGGDGTLQARRLWNKWSPSSRSVGKFDEDYTLTASYYMDALTQLMTDYGFGLTAYLDMTNSLVKVAASMGTDMSSSIVLAYRNGNVDKLEYNLDYESTYNAIIYPKVNGSSTTYTFYAPSAATTETGFYWREGYTTIPSNTVELTEAKKYYNENKAEEELTVTVNERVSLTLGSTVKVIYHDKEYIKQVTQLQYVFEFGNTHVIATIGKPHKNLLRRLKYVL